LRHFPAHLRWRLGMIDYIAHQLPAWRFARDAGGGHNRAAWRLEIELCWHSRIASAMPLPSSQYCLQRNGIKRCM
jgi:hypothetical protein